MKKELQGSWKRVFLLVSLSCLIFTSLIFIAYHFAYWNRVYPGITIVGQSVGNLALTETEEKLTAEIPQATSSATLNLYSGNQKWEIGLEKIGFAYDATGTAQKAFQVGRSDSLWTNIKTKIGAFFRKINLNWNYSLNQSQLETEIDKITQQLFIPAVEPTIKIVEKKVIIEEGRSGQEINQRELFARIYHHWATLDTGPVEMPAIQILPSLNDEQIENTRQRAEKFLGKKLIFTDNGTHWQLEEKELIQFLSFTNGFDQDKIASWSANLATTINRPPQDATFQFINGQVIEFQPAKEGKTLNQERTIDLIAKNLMAFEATLTNGQADQEEITAKLPIVITPPVIKTAAVNNLGINELIGRGISYFRGSIISRIHNIKLASSRINGLLIAPNEVFSFNQALGEVDKSTGYQEAYIIKEGRTVLGDGGGVCQVSTTLFRATLNAGLPIIERQAHAYRVAYYEQNSPVGLDATVFNPTADLKFKNDTPAHILIQTKVNLKNSSLVFDLYGTHDGRVVTLSKPRIWDQIPPPPDLYQDDPTLPVGTIKQIDWKAWGAKVAFDYKVIHNGEVLQDRTFYSSYRPWQAVFFRGTGPIQ